MRPAPQDNQLMSKHCLISFEPQRRLEWRGRTTRTKQSSPIIPQA
jgi:hypothetical protein